TAAADSRNEHRILRPHAQVRQDLLHLGQDRIVAAAGTPADVLIGGKIGRLQNGKINTHVAATLFTSTQNRSPSFTVPPPAAARRRPTVQRAAALACRAGAFPDPLLALANRSICSTNSLTLNGFPWTL